MSRRIVVPLTDGFLFSMQAAAGTDGHTGAGAAEAAQPDFDDSQWEPVTVPHDWAIAGPFDAGHDVQKTTIVEDGETRPAEHLGRTGGLPHVGTAWYRIWCSRSVLTDGESAAPGAERPADRPSEEMRTFVELDGVMSHATVFCNGRRVGGRPYGYSSFSLELTDEAGSTDPFLLAVRVDNKPDASRWYPGAGIYRNARLVFTSPLRIAYCGVTVTSRLRPTGGATVQIRTELSDARQRPVSELPVTVRTKINDPAGTTVADVETTADGAEPAASVVELSEARLWSPDSPQLYTALTRVLVDGIAVDECATTFGIRSARFDAEQGFLLNGKRLPLKGVCMHHDLGALGAAVNVRAMERRLEILQDMGCNAIRTSHNPPAPELLDLTDRMGFLVIDEAFDEWRVAKVGNGYHSLFEEWAERDLRDLIRRDRNHPSVILYSIGNEVRDQATPEGRETAEWLTSICHEEDPTRPVTAAFNNSEDAIANGLAAAVDVPGWNYKPHRYADYHAEHPTWPMYGSETASCVSSRGEYYVPVVEERDHRRETLHVTSYDVAAPPWGYSPEYEFAALEACPAIAGEFVWTGFDYLGEPTPYKTEWPSRSAYFGIVDLAGFPKDRYYLYRSRWSDEPTVHLFPHWNWPGHEGELIPVHCYTSFASAELFVNARSVGRKERGTAPRPAVTAGQMELLDRYRFRWDVPYEPGEVSVVVYDESGARAEAATVRTAGAPARLDLSPDRTTIAADGRDLSFVSVSVVDAAGTVCPHADYEIRFAVEGPGRLIATDNGDQTSLVPFQSSVRRVFHGRCLAIVAADRGKNPGTITISATAVEGVPAAGTAAVVRTVRTEPR